MTMLSRKRGRRALQPPQSGSSPGDARAQPVPAAPARSEPPSVRDELASVQDGEYVALTGRIQSCAETLTAPLSGAACAAYLAVARSRLRDYAPTPDVDLVEMRVAPMVVAVSDGSVVLEGECVVVARTTEVSPRDSERERAFLVRRQLQHFLPSTQFSEATLSVDDWVWVSGVAQREFTGEHGYRDRPVRFRLISGPGRSVALGRARSSHRSWHARH
ncbi:MAG TPA: hypothetical protein VGD80_15840 [Kofleriaceae bacterium]